MKTLQSFWWIISLQLKTSKKFFVWIIFHSIYTGVNNVVHTYFGAKFIASVAAAGMHHGAASSVYKWLALILISEIFSISFNSINRIVTSRFDQKLELTLNELIFTKLYQLSQEQFDDQEFNTKLGRAIDGLYSIGRVLKESSSALTAFVVFIGAISTIMVVAPIIGLIVVATTVPISYLRIRQNKLYESVYKKTEPYERVARRSVWMLMDPKTMPEIRLMNAFKHLLTAWKTNMKKAQDMVFATDKKTLPTDTGTLLVEPAVTFGADIYFFKLLLNGAIGFDRFVFLVGLLEQASNAVSTLASSVDTLHELSINMQNFRDIQATPPAIPNGKTIVTRPLTIEFKNVCFTYPGAEQPSLDDVSFLIVPGSKLALVGENGAGKSTLIKLLLRQYLPQTGTITVNGVDMKDVNQESYYGSLSNLSQDFLVVNHLTIRDNLIIGLNRVVEDEEITDTLDLVNANGFINKLPHKLASRLDTSFDDGTGLSGGQTQRLGVARALLRNGDIMLLDEPTSAIDAKAEYAIFNNIYKAHADRTTLIVSHRFSTVRKADQIIVMEQGKIIEYGSHEELVKYDGLYKEMFDAQAEGYR